MPARLIRRLGLGAAAALVAVLVAHGLAWSWATGEIERQLAATLAAPPPGWQAGAGPLRRTGWPLAATVEAPALAVTAPGAALRWQAERLSVSIALARPTTLDIAAHGAQSLQLGPAAPVPLTAGRMHALVPLGAPTPSVTLAVEDLAARLPDGPLALARLDARAGWNPAARAGETAATLAVDARRLALPPSRPWPLGPLVDTLALDATVTGPLSSVQDLAARAEAWRDGGGTLALRALTLRWAELALSGTATLGLDARLQPAGAATTRIAGHDAALRALAEAGLLPPRTALAAGAVLALMARPPAEGGAPVVEVPLTLQDRTLAMGRIPLLRLPELLWRPPP